MTSYRRILLFASNYSNSDKEKKVWREEMKNKLNYGIIGEREREERGKKWIS